VPTQAHQQIAGGKSHPTQRITLPNALTAIRGESGASIYRRKKQREIRQANDTNLQDLRKCGETKGWPELLKRADAEASSGKIRMPPELIEKFRKEGVLFFSCNGANGGKQEGKVAVLFTHPHNALLAAQSDEEQRQIARQAVRGKRRLPSRGQISVFQTFEESMRAVMHAHVSELYGKENLKFGVLSPIDDIKFELSFRGGEKRELLDGVRDTYAKILSNTEFMRNFLAVQGTLELEDNMHLIDTGNTPALGSVVWASGRRFEARLESMKPAIAKAERRLALFEGHISFRLESNPESERMRSNLIALKMWKVWHALQELKIQFHDCYAERRVKFLQAHKTESYRILDNLLLTKDKACIQKLLEHWHFFSSIDLLGVVHESRSQKPDLLRISRHVQSSAAMLEQGAIFRGYIEDPALGSFVSGKSKQGAQHALTWDIGHVMQSLPGIFSSTDEKYAIVPKVKNALTALFEFIFQPGIEIARQKMLKAPTGEKHGEALFEFRNAFAMQPKYYMMAKAIGKVQILLGQFRAEEALARLQNGRARMPAKENGAI